MRWILWALLAVCAGCGSRVPESSGLTVNSQLASMVPADATLLMGVRMDAVRKSPLFAKYLPELLARGESKSGGDLLAYHEQLEEAIIASTGRKMSAAVRISGDGDASGDALQAVRSVHVASATAAVPSRVRGRIP